MNLVATIWAFFRGLVCFLFAALLAGGGCLTIWRFSQGTVPLSNALYSLVALAVAVWVAWYAVYDSAFGRRMFAARSEEHTSELQSLMRISYAVFCLKKKKTE